MQHGTQLISASLQNLKKSKNNKDQKTTQLQFSSSMSPTCGISAHPRNLRNTSSATSFSTSKAALPCHICNNFSTWGRLLKPNWFDGQHRRGYHICGWCKETCCFELWEMKCTQKYLKTYWCRHFSNAKSIMAVRRYIFFINSLRFQR